MNNKFNVINTKNRTYHFFNDVIHMKIFDPNNIKIDEMSCKTILDYYIGYVTIKELKLVKIKSVNSLYFFFSKANEYFEEINRKKYLALFPTNEGKEIAKKCDGIRSEIRDLIR